MKKGAGKAKGGEFERNICKALSLWLSKGKRDDLLWRSAMSGGRASVKFKKGEKNISQVGDISAIDPAGNLLTDKFVVECKTYRNVHSESLIYTPSKKTECLINWWIKATDSAFKVGKEPLLIFKQSGRPVLIGMTISVANIFQVQGVTNFFYNISIVDFMDFISSVLPNKLNKV